MEPIQIDFLGIPVSFFIATVVLYPFVETILFHGFVGKAVERLCWGNALLTSAIMWAGFSLMHGINKGWGSIIPVGFGGAIPITFMFYYLLKQKKDWGTILFWTFLCHVVWNFVIYAKLCLILIFDKPLP